MHAGSHHSIWEPMTATNKLPYTMNSTLDIQWQPRNDLAIDIGYVNGLGRHEIIPIPFNQARIATPTNPLCGTAAVCPSTSAPYAQFYYLRLHGAIGRSLAVRRARLISIPARSACLPDRRARIWDR